MNDSFFCGRRISSFSRSKIQKGKQKNERLMAGSYEKNKESIGQRNQNGTAGQGETRGRRATVSGLTVARSIPRGSLYV